jgi:hypothetical protein
MTDLNEINERIKKYVFNLFQPENKKQREDLKKWISDEKKKGKIKKNTIYSYFNHLNDCILSYREVNINPKKRASKNLKSFPKDVENDLLIIVYNMYNEGLDATLELPIIRILGDKIIKKKLKSQLKVNKFAYLNYESPDNENSDTLINLKVIQDPDYFNFFQEFMIIATKISTEEDYKNVNQKIISREKADELYDYICKIGDKYKYQDGYLSIFYSYMLWYYQEFRLDIVWTNRKYDLLSLFAMFELSMERLTEYIKENFNRINEIGIKECLIEMLTSIKDDKRFADKSKNLKIDNNDSNYEIIKKIRGLVSDDEINTIVNMKKSKLKEGKNLNPESELIKKIFETYPEYYDDEIKELTTKNLIGTKEFIFNEERTKEFKDLIDGEIKNFVGEIKDLKEQIKKNLIDVKEDDEYCFVGDIHGSIHSLLRFILNLIKDKKMSLDWTIIGDKFNIIFLGDYADRGSYGLEVYYILLKLKKKNPGHIYLCQGNHETEEQMKGRNILKGEIRQKTDLNPTDMINKFLKLFKIFPITIFLSKDGKYIECTHAFPIFKKKDYFAECIMVNPQYILNNEQSDYWNYQLNDIYLYNVSDEEENNIDKSDKLTLGQFGNTLKDTKKQMKDSNIAAIFRGHNHNNFGLKMFPSSKKEYDNKSKLDKYKRKTFKGFNEYNDGLDWNDLYPDKNTIKLNDQNIIPIFTLSSATGNIIKIDTDTFCILKISEKLEESVVTVYETKIERGKSGELTKLPLPL